MGEVRHLVLGDGGREGLGIARPPSEYGHHLIEVSEPFVGGDGLRDSIPIVVLEEPDALAVDPPGIIDVLDRLPDSKPCILPNVRCWTGKVVEGAELDLTLRPCL